MFQREANGSDGSDAGAGNTPTPWMDELPGEINREQVNPQPPQRGEMCKWNVRERNFEERSTSAPRS